MDPVTRAFVAATEQFAKQEQIPVVQFRKGQRKDEVMAEHLARFDKPEGVVMLGKAQEKTPVFRTEKRRNPETGRSYPWIVRSTAMINHYYWYCLDRELGPFFLKFASCFPYHAQLCLNGHEYAKCQLRREGIGFKALDNGFVSLTQVLDRPLHGRILFEEIIRENLAIGRPDRVQLIFNRRVTRRTPGRFRTRVLTNRGDSLAARGLQETPASNNISNRSRTCLRWRHGPRPRSTTRAIFPRQTAV